MNKGQLIKLAESGDRDAKYQLGNLAEDAGQMDEAKKWFHEAAAAGSPAAMNAIGLLAHTEGDLERARNWYEKAANNGYSMALNNLGTISEDPKEARKWFEAGVKAGNSLAMFNLGLIFQESGEEKQSSDLFLASAKLGDSNSMVQLGLIAEEVDNLQEARKWYLRAVELENSQAMYNLGLLEQNLGDIAEAKKLYERALEAGNLWPLNNLARIAEVEGDMIRAVSLYRDAAENGDATAMTNLGILEEESGNLSEAIKWYEQAAALDYLDAMFQLGKIASSSGDADQARTWWGKAGALGHEGSIDALSDQQSDNLDADDEDYDEDYDENYEIWSRYKKYALGTKKSKSDLKRSDFEYYELFEKLSKLELLDIWIEWTRAFDFQREVTKRHEKIGDQFDYLHSDEDTGEEFEDDERLSIDSKYLPNDVTEDYLFNIESGDCSISAKKPRIDTTELDEEDENRSDYYLSSRIDCLEHKSSKECYESKCLAAAITAGSGLGDGVYQTAAYTGKDGQIESVLAFFYWFNESDEYLSELVNSVSGVGFLRNHIPIVIGEIHSAGELTFGDSVAWAMSEDMNDLESYKRVTFQVPSDDYLIIGWINADSLDLDYNRTFVLGAYRGSLKKYFLNLAEAYPVMKDFKKIFAEKGFIDL
jgi:TPR repeat protein